MRTTHIRPTDFGGKIASVPGASFHHRSFTRFHNPRRPPSSACLHYYAEHHRRDRIPSSVMVLTVFTATSKQRSPKLLPYRFSGIGAINMSALSLWFITDSLSATHGEKPYQLLFFLSSTPLRTTNTAAFNSGDDPRFIEDLPRRHPEARLTGHSTLPQRSSDQPSVVPHYQRCSRTPRELVQSRASYDNWRQESTSEPYDGASASLATASTGSSILPCLFIAVPASQSSPLSIAPCLLCSLLTTLGQHLSKGLG